MVETIIRLVIAIVRYPLIATHVVATVVFAGFWVVSVPVGTDSREVAKTWAVAAAWCGGAAFVFGLFAFWSRRRGAGLVNAILIIAGSVTIGVIASLVGVVSPEGCAPGNLSCNPSFWTRLAAFLGMEPGLLMLCLISWLGWASRTPERDVPQSIATIG